MKPSPLALAGLSLVALLGAACGKDDAVPAAVGAPTTSTTAGADETTTTAAGGSTTTAPAEEAGPSDTPAAQTRATLAALLEEHVYLTGITVSSVVGSGSGSPTATAAAGSLDDNSVALAEAVSGAFDPTVGEEFLRLWRGHVTDFVDYTGARQAGDAASAAAAVERLDQYRSDTGDLLDEASDGAIPADTVTEDLDVHVQSVLAVVDATVAASADAVPLLREAAGHMPGTAAVLAAGIAASSAE